MCTRSWRRKFALGRTPVAMQDGGRPVEQTNYIPRASLAPPLPVRFFFTKFFILRVQKCRAFLKLLMAKKNIVLESNTNVNDWFVIDLLFVLFGYNTNSCYLKWVKYLYISTLNNFSGRTWEFSVYVPYATIYLCKLKMFLWL